VTGIDHDALAAAMPWETAPFALVDARDETSAQLPQSWWPISESDDPEERKHTALALWNIEFLDLIPRFAHALHNGLIDVRIVKHQWIETPSLDYIIAAGNSYGVWIGENPATFGDQIPPLFESLPQPVQVYLRQVHAGFTTWDRESCGLTPPSLMKTLASHWGDPDDESMVEWYEDTYDPPAFRRLLRVTGRGPHADLLVSPDLPAGTAVTYFEPDFELKQFGESLDLFMTMPLEE
jgi:hypothetical protein